MQEEFTAEQNNRYVYEVWRNLQSRICGRNEPAVCESIATIEEFLVFHRDEEEHAEKGSRKRTRKRRRKGESSGV